MVNLNATIEYVPLIGISYRNIRPVFGNTVYGIELDFWTPEFCTVNGQLLGTLLKLSGWLCSVYTMGMIALPISAGRESQLSWKSPWRSSELFSKNTVLWLD